MKRQLIFLFALCFSQLILAQKISYNETFDSKKTIWNYNENRLKASSKNGKLTIENKSKFDAQWLLQNLIPNPDKTDFTIETEVTFLDIQKPTSQFSVIWSAYNNEASYRSVTLSANQKSQLSYHNRKDVDFYKPWKDQKDGFEILKINKIKIVKRGSNSKVYINEKVIHQLGGTAYYGSKIGFKVSPETKIAVHKLKITTYKKQAITIVSSFNPSNKIEKIDALSDPNVEEALPIITADGETLYLVLKDSKLNTVTTNDDVWYSTKNRFNKWNLYKNIGRPINNEAHNFVVSVSPDNNTLLVGNHYSENGRKLTGPGVSITHRTKDGWKIPKPLIIEGYSNSNQFSEFSLSSTKKQLLLAIERPNGQGDKDLYVSFKTENNTWTTPLSLGKTINTFESEAYPFLASDGRTLFFSSKGHQGYGSHDLFVSKRLDNSWTNWSTPKNLGPTINGTSGDMSIYLTADGTKAYVGKDSDIYFTENAVNLDPVILVKGKVYDSKTKEILFAPVKYYNLNTNKELGIARSNPNTGEYKIVLPYGERYSFMAEKEGYYSQTKNIDLTELKAYEEIEVDLYLDPIEKGQVIRLNNIFFDSGKYDLLPTSYAELNKLLELLEKNSKLKIEIAGHTDWIGKDKDNLILSQNRTNAVVNFLVEKGIDKNRLSAKGYGETKFIATNTTKEGQQLNRRVEFEIKDL